MDTKDPTIDINPDVAHHVFHRMKLAGRGIPEDKVRNILRAAEQYLRAIAGNATYKHEFKFQVTEIEQPPTPKSPTMWFTEIVIGMRFFGIPSEHVRKMMAEAKMIEDAKKAARDGGIWEYFSNPLGDKAKA